MTSTSSQATRSSPPWQRAGSARQCPSISPSQQTAGNSGRRAKRLHPPGTIPEEASENPGVEFKETQFKNDDSSDTPARHTRESGHDHRAGQPDHECPGVRPDAARVHPGLPHDIPRLDPALRPRCRARDRHRRHPGPWLHCRQGIRHSCGGRHRQRHSGGLRAVKPWRWTETRVPLLSRQATDFCARLSRRLAFVRRESDGLVKKDPDATRAPTRVALRHRLE